MQGGGDGLSYPQKRSSGPLHPLRGGNAEHLQPFPDYGLKRHEEREPCQGQGRLASKHPCFVVISVEGGDEIDE